MRETLVQCPRCLARYTALLWEEPPAITLRCVECDAPLPERVDGEFVFAILQPPTVH
jgi:Zn ribbon nucleic-acid-binding protein